jgi:hypothetical protein
LKSSVIQYPLTIGILDNLEDKTHIEAIATAFDLEAIAVPLGVEVPLVVAFESQL